MKITFLGTNGWYDSSTGNTVSVLVDTDDEYIILDAGFGFYKIKDYIKSKKPVYLFISHLHLDHIIGLHTLPLLHLGQGIDVFLPKALRKDLHAFLRIPFMYPLGLLPTRLRFHNALGRSIVPLKFETAVLRHRVRCYGYRFHLKGGEVAYCTDTGMCDNLHRLAQGADVLIAESAMSYEDEGLNLFHITPQTAAKVARDAGVKRLFLSHFDPVSYPSIKDRKKAEAAAQKIFVNTVAADDGTAINI